MVEATLVLMLLAFVQDAASRTLGATVFPLHLVAASQRIRPGQALPVCPSGYVVLSGLVRDTDWDRYYTGAVIPWSCVRNMKGLQVGGPRSPFVAYWEDTHGKYTLTYPETAYGGGDCDDADPYVWRAAPNLVLDRDGDFHHVGSATPQCVGNAVLIVDLLPTAVQRFVGPGGRAEWISDHASLGTDVNDYNGNVFMFIEGGTDKNQNGCVEEGAPSLLQGGDSATIEGRRYFRGPDGAFDVLFKDDIKCFGDPEDGVSP